MLVLRIAKETNYFMHDQAGERREREEREKTEQAAVFVSLSLLQPFTYKVHSAARST